MGTWTADAITGGYPYTLTGSGRTALMAPGSFAALQAVKVQCVTIDDNIKVIVNATDDGRWGWEIGIEGSNVIVRPCIAGVPGSTITLGASDLPASASASVAHGLSSGVPFPLEVRLIGGVFEVRLNDSTDPLIKFNPSNQTSNPFTFFTGFGVVSSVTGATIAQFQTCPLVSQNAARADVIVAVVDGHVHAGLTPASMTRVASGVFPPDVLVDMDAFNGSMKIVGGGKAVSFNPRSFTVEQYVDKDHNRSPDPVKLPGADAPGTTTAKIFVTHRNRGTFAQMDDDPQNVVFTAVGDATDVDTGTGLPGAAWSLDGYKAAKVGEPVVAIQVASSAALIVACQNSTYQVSGDPALGQVETTPMSLDTGASSKDAMCLAQRGIVLMHSPKGFVVLAQGNPAQNLSEKVLTQGIQLNQAQLANYFTVVIRDAQRYGVHIWLTARTGLGRHWWYDERIGNFESGAGGFFEDVYPQDKQPTCATEWQGQVLFITRDGNLGKFDDATQTDFGAFIDSRITLALARGDTAGDVSLESFGMAVGVGSSPVKVVIYGGRTPQDAFDPARRRSLYSETVKSMRTGSIPCRVRSGALTVVLQSKQPQAGNAQAWALERFEVDATTKKIGSAS